MDIRLRRFTVERGTKIEHWRVYWDYNNPHVEYPILDRVAVVTQRGQILAPGLTVYTRTW